MLGDNIRKLRKIKGFTETELAEAVGVKQPYINKIEKNEKVPLIPLLQKIANALNTSVQELLENHGSEEFNKDSLKSLRGKMSYKEFSAHLENKGVELIGDGLYISPTILKQYEKGIDVPPEPVLKYIAKVENVDIGFFYSSNKSEVFYSDKKASLWDLSFMDEDLRNWVSNPDNINYIKLMYQAYKETKK